MPDLCDASCQKLIIDFVLSIQAAIRYAYVLSFTSNVDAKHAATASYYAGTAEDAFERVALEMNAGHLSEDQRNRLITQSLKECYRADEMVEWSLESSADLIANAEERTIEIDAWVKQNQAWYTAFAAEVGLK